MKVEYPAWHSRRFVLTASPLADDDVCLCLETKKKEEVKILFKGKIQEFGLFVSFLDNRLKDIEDLRELTKKGWEEE